MNKKSVPACKKNLKSPLRRLRRPTDSPLEGQDFREGVRDPGRQPLVVGSADRRAILSGIALAYRQYTHGDNIALRGLDDGTTGFKDTGRDNTMG